MIKVLFFSEWYPNRNDEMLGLFVRKHVEAISLFNDVQVLYIQADENRNELEIVENKFDKYKEIIIYFPYKKAGVFSKFIKTIHHFNAYYKGWGLIKKNGFTPDIIHTNIISINVFIAYLVNVFAGIPYVITEHWSRYLNGRKAFSNRLDAWITKKLVRKSSAIFPVSEILKKGMLDNGLFNEKYEIINNVVSDVFFEDLPAVLFKKKQILHISCFDEHSKNISGIMRGLELLSAKRNDFELTIIGNGPDFEKIKAYSKSLKINKGALSFVGEKTPEEVAMYFRSSDIFVLFSNYETAAVVIAESLVCGVPVISTKVGIALEVIDNSNGILVDIGDEKSLVEAMDFALDNLEIFDNQLIKKSFRDKYSYSTVGKKITEEYKKILNR